MTAAWVRKQWEGADFGDQRLTQRAIKIGQACLERPDLSLPKKCRTWANTKGAYRFFNSNKVSHEELQKVHSQNTISDSKKTEGTVLFIQRPFNSEVRHLQVQY